MDFSNFPWAQLLQNVGQGMIGAPNLGVGLGQGAANFANQQKYNHLLGSMFASPQPNNVSVTPKVSLDANGQVNRPDASAYQQPAFSGGGPLAGTSSAMQDLFKTVSPDQGMPLLLSMLQPHGVETVTDGEGQVHRIDKLTGQDLGTIGGKKPLDVAPGHQLVGQGQPQAAPAPVAPTLNDLSHAILQQESGSNPKVHTSVDGAVGQAQILPSTFAQYAKPGENVANPADNLAVHQRILTDYAQKFGGDAARIATAYFSGPNNVAPPGSQTPWIRDVKDGTGKSVSSYVSDVLSKAQASAAPPPSQLASSEYTPLYTAPEDPGKIWKTMTPDQLKQYNALPGSTINGDGEVQRVSQYNSPSLLNDPAVQTAAQTYIKTGHMPVTMGRNMAAQAAVMNAVASAKPPDMSEEDWAGVLAKNAQNYKAAQASVTNFDQGKLGNQVRSFNVAISHLNTLGSLSTALANGDTQGINALNNTFKTQFGKPAPTNFNAARDIVADEVTKAIIGAGGGVQDREKAAATISAAQSPAQLAGVINTYKTLMAGQLHGLAQQYQVSTGRSDFTSRLSPDVVGLLNNSPPPVVHAAAQAAQTAPTKVGRFTVQIVTP